MTRRLVFAAALALAAPAQAQVFHSVPGARPVPDESPALGVAIGFGEDMFRLVGFGRFNASRSSDLGFEFAYDDIDAGPGSDDQGLVGGGVDYKHLVVRQAGDTPVDVAVQVGAGFLTRSDFTLIKVPFGATASRSFPLEGNRVVTPSGGVFLVVDFVDFDTPAGSGSDSELDVELRLGGSVDIVERASVFAALHAGNGTMFFLGFKASL